MAKDRPVMNKNELQEIAQNIKAEDDLTNFLQMLTKVTVAALIPN